MSTPEIIPFVPPMSLLDSPPAGLPRNLSNDPSEVSTSHGFFALPGEIRNKIYRYLLSPNYNILGPYEDFRRTKVLFDRDSFIKLFEQKKYAHDGYEFPRKSIAYRYMPALLSANHRICEEASPIFYEENQFVCFRTSAPGLSRVLEECGFMKVSMNLVNHKWMATISLLFHNHFRNRFVYIIPSAELGTLARIFLKANIAQLLVYSGCHLRITLNKYMPTISNNLAMLVLQPIRELYNVYRLQIDDRLVPHTQPLYNLMLPDRFRWEVFLMRIIGDYKNSQILYLDGNMRSALLWATSSIQDLDGGRQTHFSAWVMKGDNFKNRSSMLRQEMHIWFNKLVLEISMPVEGSMNGTNSDDGPERHIRNCAGLDAASLDIVWNGWLATADLGLGRSKEALMNYNNMYAGKWTGGRRLARCIREELVFAIQCWKESWPTIEQDYADAAQEIIERDKLRKGWMNLDT